MMLDITVEIDGTYDECEDVLDQIEDAIAEQALLEIAPKATARIVACDEIPATYQEVQT